MNLSTYQRALELARRGFRGPKQRRAMRLRAALFAGTPHAPALRKRAYCAAQRRGRAFGALVVAGVAMFGLLTPRRTAP